MPWSVSALAVLLAAAPSGVPKVSIDMSLVDPARITIATQKAELVLGSEKTIEFKVKSRRFSVRTKATVGEKAGCYLIEVWMVDRDIDESGRFSRTEWEGKGDVCAGLYTTLGPGTETRVRVAVPPKR